MEIGTFLFVESLRKRAGFEGGPFSMIRSRLILDKTLFHKDCLVESPHDPKLKQHFENYGMVLICEKRMRLKLTRVSSLSSETIE